MFSGGSSGYAPSSSEVETSLFSLTKKEGIKDDVMVN